MIRRVAGAGLVLASGAFAPLAWGQSAQGDVSITIYNNDLALVQDIRTLDLTAGRAAIDFPDVSAKIRPETVTIAAPGAGVVEQNFDYDLLSPERLMDKAVGQMVTVVRTNPATGAETREPARVLANNGGTLLQRGNRIEVLGQAPHDRVVFDSLPNGLRASPTLSVTLDAARAGRRPVTLSYLSTGFSWKADYVALYDETARTIDVQGWITLHNTSGTGYDKARLLLVAGEVGANPDEQPWQRAQRLQSRANPGTESASREQLGDFYVYPIAGRTVLANQQQKQVGFLDVKGVKADKAYVYRNPWLANQTEARSFDTLLRFSSARAGGLGDALPAGTVRVYMRDARGQPQFIGENAIPHTPMGSTLEIRTGQAFDVKVRPELVRRERIDSAEWERVLRYRSSAQGVPAGTVTVDRAVVYWRSEMRYHLTNARPQSVTVDLVQAGLDGWGHDTRIPFESVKGEQVSPDERVWHVTVPANGEETLNVQFDTQY